MIIDDKYGQRIFDMIDAKSRVKNSGIEEELVLELCSFIQYTEELTQALKRSNKNPKNKMIRERDVAEAKSLLGEDEEISLDDPFIPEEQFEIDDLTVYELIELRDRCNIEIEAYTYAFLHDMLDIKDELEELKQTITITKTSKNNKEKG